MSDLSSWRLTYDQFKPKQEGLREALCTLGNGYFATRGAIPEALASKIHYPGTYIAGVYNQLSTHIAGRTVVNEDMVNCPNWIFLTFKIGNGEWFYPARHWILSYQQELDMQKGTLSRKILFENKKGQRTLIEASRIISMANPHFGAMKYVIKPQNYSDWIRVRTMLDGSVVNAGVVRYSQLNSKHWKSHSLGSFSHNGIFLTMKTSNSNIEVAEAAKLRVFVGQAEVRPKIKCLSEKKERIGQEIRIFITKKQFCKIEKVVSIYTSKDEGIHNPTKAAAESLQNARSFKNLLVTHKKAWDKLWKMFDIQIKGDEFSQRVLRLHIFHLLQTVSMYNLKIDAGLPARGLHGEAYRGHIFWDQIFAIPFYDLHIPEISQALLLYRYRRLEKAKESAKKSGYHGAMFPWQSGNSGKEETQIIHLNPVSGTWGPDYSHLQRHVSFAIAYNAWQHYKKTNDLDFLLRYGAEMILSIAQFAASLVKYDTNDGRYHTDGLVGPDEFHECNSGFEHPGLRDNAYSNLMIVATIIMAKEILSMLSKGDKNRIIKKIGLQEKDFRLWDNITEKMNIVINRDGIVSQFDGYFALKELDWHRYISKYGNIQRLDRILKAEGESPDDYKVSKQADALMFFYLFELSQVEDIFKNLGYRFDVNTLRNNFDYYVIRTSHGSTLSKVVHCFLAQILGGPKESWGWFQQVLESDLYDTQGATTPEGIHTGVMAGSIDIVIRGFLGIDTQEDIIRIKPDLPGHWQRVKLKFRHRERWISLSVTKSRMNILIQGPKRKSAKVPVVINNKLHNLFLEKTVSIPLK
ncbi:MAG: glycoside hydrolase family 65 protein [Candidatus Omnitrophota bacterium]|jgi:alpha,alpha-trehalase